VDGIAAIVDDEVVLLSEVDRMAEPVLAGLEAQHGPVPSEVRRQIRVQAVETLINNKLIEDAATRFGLNASEADIDRAVEAIATNAGVSPNEIYAAAKAQGLDKEDYRKQLGAEITRMKVISSAVRSRVAVSDDEVTALFDRRYRNVKPGIHARVRHILLTWPPELADEEKAAIWAKAEEIRKEALSGRDFGALAREYSQAPSAIDGGLTVFREGEVAPELSPYAFGMKPGEVSPPVQTRHGVNLIKVLERFDPSTISLEEMHDRLYSELIEQKTQQQVDPWLKELRSNRYIEVVAPDLR
jgi:peptidyl-prolyl cis-trans isomerase SurA